MIDELRARMDSAAGTSDGAPPVADLWAGGRSRRKRRRVIAGGAGGLAVLVVVAALVTVGGRGDGDGDVTAGPVGEASTTTVGQGAGGGGGVAEPTEEPENAVTLTGPTAVLPGETFDVEVGAPEGWTVIGGMGNTWETRIDGEWVLTHYVSPGLDAEEPATMPAEGDILFPAIGLFFDGPITLLAPPVDEVHASTVRVCLPVSVEAGSAAAEPPPDPPDFEPCHQMEVGEDPAAEPPPSDTTSTEPPTPPTEGDATPGPTTVPPSSTTPPAPPTTHPAAGPVVLTGPPSVVEGRQLSIGFSWPQGGSGTVEGADIDWFAAEGTGWRQTHFMKAGSPLVTAPIGEATTPESRPLPASGSMALRAPAAGEAPLGRSRICVDVEVPGETSPRRACVELDLLAAP